jgi:hypothetical protein
MPPIKPEEKTSIICPNEDCHQRIDGVITLRGKKVCPHCKEPIPSFLLKKLEEK